MGQNSERNCSPLEEDVMRHRRTTPPNSLDPTKSDGTSVVNIQTHNLALATNISNRSTAQMNLDSPIILLVQNNLINLRVLQVFCTRQGYTSIFSSDNGLDAVTQYERLALTPSTNQMLATSRIIVFMAISLPDVDGCEATRRIRKLEDSVQREQTNMGASGRSFIVGVTRLLSEQRRREAFDAGVDEYLILPLRAEDMRRVLEKGCWRKGYDDNQNNREKPG